MTVSMSKGRRDLMSISSTECSPSRPGLSGPLQVWTIGPQLTSVTSVPSWTTFALPNGMKSSSAGTSSFTVR